MQQHAQSIANKRMLCTRCITSSCMLSDWPRVRESQGWNFLFTAQ